MSRLALCAALFALATALAGCTHAFRDRIVDLRNAQGDAALDAGNVVEAEKEYGLAIALAPNDEHARAGYAKVLYLHAKANYLSGDIDDASVEIQKALKYAPKDAATLDLASAIDQAAIRRDVVVQNFPSYKATSDAISERLKADALAIKDIQLQIHAFHTDYDVSHLRKAIALSSDLETEQHLVTWRLSAYKNQIEAGAPGETRAPSEVDAPGLLPIP